MLAAEVVDASVMQWAVGAALAGAVSLFGALAKKAFTDLASQVSTVGTKMDALVASQAHHDTRVSVLEEKVAALDEEMERVRNRIHKHGDVLTNLQARVINRTVSGSFPAVGGDDE